MSKSLISEIEELLDSGSSIDFYSKVSNLFMKQNRLVLKSVKDLLFKHFVVEDYQRGYKWTQEQVQQLLEDIAEYNPSDDGFYCLQPVVVKRLKQDDELKWELIDGQQRLTTIFLILQYLGYERTYKIDYKTRDSSGNFLSKETLKNVAEIETWQNFLDTNQDKDYNNSDVYHFFHALKTIDNFFDKNKETKENWKDKLLSNTKVIWYEANSEELHSNDDARNGQDVSSKDESIKIFTRLNSGKIPLENSELIKAVMLNQLNEEYKNNPDLVELKKRELIMQWDHIEHQLHEKDFWAFLTKQKKRSDDPDPAIRIDLIFDTLFADESGHNAFFLIQEQLNKKAQKNKNKDKTVDEIWGEVQDAFNRFYEWYSHDELFHLTGFHLTQEISTISNLLKESKDNHRSAFIRKLQLKIVQEFLKIGKSFKPWKEWDYQEDYKDVKKLLILFNIGLHQQNGTRFPFELQDNWTLEHIHAQNQQDICQEDKNKLLKFYQLEEGSLLQDESKDDLIHTVGNLTLLSQSLNSGIGNKIFALKRKTILESLDSYVPLGTYQVFSKAYSEKNIQMHIWTGDDQAAYIGRVENTICSLLNLNDTEHKK